MAPWTPPLFAWQAWHLATSTVTLRGRRGTWRHGRAFCVAGVALGDIGLHFAWQAWHLATSTFTLRGRRGAYATGLALVVHVVTGLKHNGSQGRIGPATGSPYCQTLLYELPRH